MEKVTSRFDISCKSSSSLLLDLHEFRLVKATFHYYSQLQTWLQTWFSTRFAARFSTSSCGFAICFRHAFDFFCRKPGREPAASISTCRDWCSRLPGSLVRARARQIQCRKNPFRASQRTCWSWIFVTYFIIRVYYTIRYDSGYLTCSKKLTGSQLSLPHGINSLTHSLLRLTSWGS